jgi:hypothetical protein
MFVVRSLTTVLIANASQGYLLAFIIIVDSHVLYFSLRFFGKNVAIYPTSRTPKHELRQQQLHNFQKSCGFW